MNRQKADRFVRLAEKRMSRLFKELRILSNLGNPYLNEYTKEQVAAIVTSLKAKVERLEGVFFFKPFIPLDEENFSFEDYLLEPAEERVANFDEDEFEYETTEHKD